jgi:hypothetical protein
LKDLQVGESEGFTKSGGSGVEPLRSDGIEWWMALALDIAPTI